MSYKAPSLKQLAAAARSALRAEVAGADPSVEPNNLSVVTKVFAGLLRGLYQRLEWIHRQAHAHSAEAALLDVLHGEAVGVTRIEAAAARGDVEIVATAVVSIAAGTRLLRADGQVFKIRNDVNTIIGTVTAGVVAEEAGRAGNALSGAALTPESAIAGVTAIAAGPAGLTGGVDRETDESYRTRILDRKRSPPHGGSPREYQTWAMAYPGVSRVYIKRATPAAGQVTALFMMDDTYAAGFPLAADVAGLKAHLQSLAPATADIVVTAPTANPINVTITSLVPGGIAMQQRVKIEIEEMFRRRATPGGTFYRAWISEAISLAPGEVSHVLTAPASDTTSTSNQLATLGTLTFA